MPTSLAPAERARLLLALYRQAPLPDKPRNALGQLKALPPADMAQRLEAAIAADDNALRALALERAVVVRDALAARGLPVGRLFLGAPKLQGAVAGAGDSNSTAGSTVAGAGDGSAQAASRAPAAPSDWQPRAELSLTLP